MSNRFNVLNKNVEDREQPIPVITPKTWSNVISQKIETVPKTNLKGLERPPHSQITISKVPIKEDINNGSSIALSDKYSLWSHGLTDKNWEISSYTQMCTINNVSEFWRMINNFDKIGHRNRHLFLMKDGIQPMWEFSENRNGGVCSFKIEVHNSLEIYENLCSHMILGSLSDIPSDINGISFCPKGNTVFVKVWNRNRDNDLSKMLNKAILNKYGSLSIKYIPNKPEY